MRDYLILSLILGIFLIGMTSAIQVNFVEPIGYVNLSTGLQGIYGHSTTVGLVWNAKCYTSHTLVFPVWWRYTSMPNSTSFASANVPCDPGAILDLYSGVWYNGNCYNSQDTIINSDPTQPNSAAYSSNWCYASPQYLDGQNLEGKYGEYQILDDSSTLLIDSNLTGDTLACGSNNCLATFNTSINDNAALVDGVRFFRILDNGTRVIDSIRSYQLEYWGNITDYSYVDNGTPVGNGSDYYSYVQTGWHYDWINFNEGDNFPNGDYQVKLIGDKNPDYNIDWQINLRGIWTSNWATWGNISTGSQAQSFLNSPTNGQVVAGGLITYNSSANITNGAKLVNTTLWTNETGSWASRNFTTLAFSGYSGTIGKSYSPNIVYWYSFDQVGGTNIIDNTSAGNNGTANTNGMLAKATGISGYAASYNVSTSNSVQAPSKTIQSINMWVYTSSERVNSYIFDARNGIPNVYAYIESNGTIMCNAAGISTLYINGNVSTCGTYNVSLHRNQWINVGANFSSGTDDVSIGSRNDAAAGSGWNGLIDEVGVFNKSLNSTEMTDLFNIENATSTSGNFFTQLWSRTYSTPGQIIKWNEQWCDSDGACGFAVQNVTFNIAPVIENSRTFDSSALSGSQENFSINVTLNPTVYPSYYAYLNYNGVNYTTIPSIVGTNYIFNTSLTTPAVTVSTNETFYWIFVLTDNGGNPTTVTTSSSIQTVNPINFDDCSVYNYTILNYTMYDEQTRAMINGTSQAANITLNLGITPTVGGSVVGIFNKTYTNKSNALVCLQNPLAASSYFLNTQVSYSAIGYVTRHNYLQYFPLNSTVVPQNISLFDLNQSFATAFLMSYKDLYYLPQANVLINIQKKFVGLNLFQTVEIEQTDSQGNAVGYFDLNPSDNAIYTITVTANNTLQATFPSVAIYCTAGTACTLPLNAGGNAIPVTDLDTYQNVLYSVNYNSSTDIFTFSFNTLDNSVQNFQSLVTLMDNYGNTTVCNQTVTTSAGTLTCSVPAQYGNTTIIAQTYINGNLISQNYYTNTPTTNSQFSGNSVILSLILFATIPLFLLGSMIWTLIGIGLALVLMTAILYISGGIFAAGSFSIWLIVVIVAIIWKMNSRGDSS